MTTTDETQHVREAFAEEAATANSDVIHFGPLYVRRGVLVWGGMLWAVAAFWWLLTVILLSALTT